MTVRVLKCGVGRGELDGGCQSSGYDGCGRPRVVGLVHAAATTLSRLRCEHTGGRARRQRATPRRERERMRRALALMIGGQCKLAFSQAFGAESGPQLERTRQTMALLIGTHPRVMLTEAFGAWSRQRADLQLEQERTRQAIWH